MSYAPKSVAAVATVMTQNGYINDGIVGDSAHSYGYHCGKDRIYGTTGRGDADYSVQHTRDKAGLSNAAMALDLGHASKSELRRFTSWLFDQCKAGKPDTSDIREVISSVDGTNVLGWTALKPDTLIPNYGDSSHLWHMHISWWRDAENHDLTGIFKRYWSEKVSTGKLIVDANAVVQIANISSGCISSWTTRVWGPTPSSALAKAPQNMNTCANVPVKVMYVTSGGFAGKYVKVGNGVSYREGL